MKRGKDDDKSMGPMFPRLHVNDTEKGGPRAPPRNKMALYEQLSIPSQRFNGGGVSSFNPNSIANSIPPSSSNPGTMNERSTFSPRQQSSLMHPTRRTDSRHSESNNQRVQQEHKRRQEDDDFRVPIFDQQSGTSQNHQNREKVRQNNKSQKENSRELGRSASNQFSRQNAKAPLKETNESSNCSHRNGSNNNSGRLPRDYRVDVQADKTLWGDNVVNASSVPIREVQREASRSPNDPTNADAVSETSMVDSICGVDISPDDVVGVIGQKHFWKARRAIVNQQRVFAVQVFELHRLIKVQRLIAGSPHLLVDDNAYIAKPPKVTPIKKIPIEFVIKPTTLKHKSDVEKAKEDSEFSAENAVGKASLSSVQNGSQTMNYRPFPLPSPSGPGPWNFNPAPGQHQWLIPVMTPSEGLVYKPYPAPGYMNPVYNGCGPPPMIGHNFPNYGAPAPPSDYHHHHQYEGPMGVNPFVAPSSHGYFPAYDTSMVNPPPVSSPRCDPPNPFNQSSTNAPIEKNGAPVPNMVKFTSSKNTEVQASTASSRSDRTRGRNALPLFPTSPPSPSPAPAYAPEPIPVSDPAPEPVRVEVPEPPRVIRVVPHNARSATASVARIFQSIQEERKQYDSG